MKSYGMPRVTRSAALMSIAIIGISQGCVEDRIQTREIAVRRESVTADPKSIQDPDKLTLDTTEQIDFSMDVSCELVRTSAKITIRITNKEHESIAFLPNLLDLQIMPSERDIVIWDVSPLSFRIAIDTSFRNQLQIGMYEPLVRYGALVQRDLQFIVVPAKGSAEVTFVIDGDSRIGGVRAVKKYVYSEARLPLWSRRDSEPWKVMMKHFCAGSPNGKYEVRIDSLTGFWQVMNQSGRTYRLSESEYDCLVRSTKGMARGSVYFARHVVEE